MRLKVVAVGVTALLAVACLYLASPLLAAHKLRSAVINADTPAIERMVDWQSVRQSLRRSIVRNARLLPIAREAAREVRPTLWQRVRSLFGHSMLDRFMARYVTPEGLPKLYRVKTTWHEKVRRRPSLAHAGVGAGWIEELQAFRRRVIRAVFTSPLRFTLVMHDRHVPGRVIASTFRLAGIGFSGFDWRLTEVSVNTEPASAKGGSVARFNGS